MGFWVWFDALAALFDGLRAGFDWARTVNGCGLALEGRRTGLLVGPSMDFAVICEGGPLFPPPKKISIYASGVLCFMFYNRACTMLCCFV